MNVFPYRVYARDMGLWVQSPDLAQAVWHRLRVDPNKWPRRLTWYAADMEILSPESIRLFVYDIEDNFRGGIGKKIYEEVVSEFTTAEIVMLDRMVRNIYTAAAEAEFQRREDAARTEKVMALRKELFGV